MAVVVFVVSFASLVLAGMVRARPLAKGRNPLVAASRVNHFWVLTKWRLYYRLELAAVVIGKNSIVYCLMVAGAALLVNDVNWVSLALFGASFFYLLRDTIRLDKLVTDTQAQQKRDRGEGLGS